MTHRRQHAPELQTGAHNHRGRPACWSDKREAKAGKPFWLEGKVCGCAVTPETWRSLLASTPDCAGCARGRIEPESTRTLAAYGAYVVGVCIGLPLLAALVLA